MSVIRNKIWSDLWNSKGRTFQVVLMIATGAFAAGMIVGGSALIPDVLTAVWRESSPSMINIQVGPPAGDDTIETLRGIRGVEEVEGALQTSIE